MTERVESLTVNIPIGAEEGMALRVPGHGLPSDAKGGIPGDLYVVIRTARDPRFARRGADLWRSESITIPEAVLGGTRTVPTLEDAVKVTIPPATQPGVVLRLAERGLPEFGGHGRGDLCLRLVVQVPERLTKKQRALYEQLQALDKPEAVQPSADQRGNRSKQERS